MKSTSLIINVVLSIAVAILYYFQFSSDKSATVKNKKSIPTGSVEGLGSQIVYLNTDSLWSKYAYVEEMKTDLLEERQRLESQFEKEARAFEQSYLNFQERAAMFSERQRGIEQEALVQKEQEIMALKENLAGRLAQSEQEKNIGIQDAIYNVLNKYNTEHSHTYVLSMSSSSDLLLADPNLDITNVIIDLLNNDYHQSKIKTD
jgi:outer membrane protein|tara:strand:+ start:4212 stop:4823 length:612 start_codon:yes stop_codon:yes gene_type:complete